MPARNMPALTQEGNMGKNVKDREEGKGRNKLVDINAGEEFKAKTKRDVSALRSEVFKYGEDIIHSESFEKAKHVPHHIHYTVAIHSVEAAVYALLITRWLKKHHTALKVDEREVVRAALLHDIGMTLDEIHDSPSYRKAFSHPKEGHRIARDVYHLNKIQLEAIRRHMWPIGIIPPRHLMGWIIVMADNMSSFNEASTMIKSRAKRRKNE